MEPFADLELKYVNEAEVEVVFGSNVTDIIIIRGGPKSSPFGVKSKLGWTVSENILDTFAILSL